MYQRIASRLPKLPFNAAFFVLVFFLSLSSLPAQKRSGPPSINVPDGTSVYRDMAYVKNGHERQKLDLYLPEHGSNLPLIIWVHGGAFRAGDKANYAPPFPIIHGDRDPLVPYQQSVLLKDALQAAGAEVTFYTVEGEGHGKFRDPRVAELTKEFLDRHLKPAGH